MARTRAFDPSDVLPKAMQVFWAKGYGDTSIDDLVAATGVSRYGLYGEWGDKRGLFLAALDEYRDCQVGYLLRELETPQAARQHIEDYFNMFPAAARSGKSNSGCLIVNSAAEFGTDDSDISMRVTKHFRRLEKAFLGAVKNAKKAGEVPASIDPAAAAIMLSGIAQGLALLMRAGEPPKKIATFVKGALAILD